MPAPYTSCAACCARRSSYCLICRPCLPYMSAWLLIRGWRSLLREEVLILPYMSALSAVYVCLAPYTGVAQPAARGGPHIICKAMCVAYIYMSALYACCVIACCARRSSHCLNMSASSALYVCLIQGWRGFMRGVGARILYQAPGAACCWVAYEYMKHSLASPIFGDFFLEEHEDDDDDHGGGGGTRGLSRHASHGGR